ncbi:hypothetical protein BaRGS_00008695 [Batillaria attramentaria]|uniref:Uncharacterized protein n=1 Tax=Batillaria attramentaria TaxID=370345 RepID=A0ABD0LMC2_9CAEN
MSEIAEKLAIPWHSKRDLATPLDTLAGYLGQAVNPDPTQPLDQCTSPQYVQAVQNLAELLRSRKKCREACKILEEVLKWAPHLEDVWLTATDIYAGCHDYDSAKQDCSDDGLEHMEQFVISHFDSTTEEMSRVDPNFLFCKLLALDFPVRKRLPPVEEDVEQTAGTGHSGEEASPAREGRCRGMTCTCCACSSGSLYSKLLALDIPVRKRLPPVKEELKEMLLQRDVYLWLCYCLLLELQGETEEAVDVFELALSSTTQAAHLALLWKCYVQFLYRRCQSSHSPATQSFQQQLQEAMFRSITTAPTLVPIRFPRQHQTQQQQWRDLSHVTNLVEFYVSMVPPDSRATALQTFYDLMPDNIPLLIRCVETALADGQLRRARSLCTAAVYDKTANLQLWKLVLALAQMEGTPKEVERLYVRAVRSLPLSVSLWKDPDSAFVFFCLSHPTRQFLLFEVSQENPVAVHTILAHCQDLGLNIQGYVATISATS